MKGRVVRSFVAAMTVAVAGLLACTEPPTLDSVLIRPAGIAAVSAASFDAVAGSPQHTVAIRVRDQDDAPLAGWVVAFAANRGTLSSATATTDAQGQASVSWTAPNVVGPATITATIPDFSLAPVGFSVNVVAGPAATMTATASTNNQSAVAGSAVAAPPEVTVADQFGNPVAAANVSFTIESGGGTINGPTLTTVGVTSDANGKAKPTSWVLGTTAGTNTLRATSSALSGQIVTFTATGTVGPVSKIVIAPGSPSSQNQTATGGTSVAVGPAVLITDANDNPVSNVVARFTVAAGGGRILANSGDVSGTTSLDATTNASGVAAIFGWRLGVLTGSSATNTLNVAAPSAPNAGTFAINATATAGPPSSITSVAESPSSNNQTTLTNSAVPIAPGVVVKDANGNVVAGTLVAFSVAGGSGSITTTPAGSPVGSANITTDASGVARVGSWTLGNVGTNTLTAVVASNTSLAFTFTATGTLGPPKTIIIAPPGNSQGQTATAGSNVAVAPAVLITDSVGNALPGVTARFAIGAGGGKIKLSDGSETASLDVGTNASGIASVFAWMVWLPGSNTLNVTIPTAPAVAGFTITATSNAGPPASIAIVTETPSSQGQTAIVGSAVPVAPAVAVKDANGFEVPGASIKFEPDVIAVVCVTFPCPTQTNGTVKATSASAAASSATIATGANGIARIFSWTLGRRGTNTMTASLESNANIAVIFNATGTAGPPASIAFVEETPSSNNQSTIANTPTPVAPGVVVKDANGLTVDAGHNVTFAIQSGGGGVSVPGGCNDPLPASVSVQTDANGVARLGCWKPGSLGSSNTLRAAVQATPSLFVTFLATGVTGPPTQITFVNNPWEYVRATFAVGGLPKVRVADAGNNPLSGQTVAWDNGGNANSSVTGTLSGATDAQGIASFPGTWTAGPTINIVIDLRATVQGVSPSLSSTVQSRTVGTPSSSLSFGTNGPVTTVVNTVVSPTPVVNLRDGQNLPIPGHPITWTLTDNPNSQATLTAPMLSTDSLGRADAGEWQVSRTAGLNRAEATPTGTSLVFVFSTQGIAGPAANIQINAGSGQTAFVSTSVPVAPSVFVSDQFFNAITSAQVTFEPTSGSGSVTNGNAFTNASGIATVGSWTLGPTAGTHTLNAFVTNNPSITIGFTATATIPPAPSAPSNFTATGVSNSQIYLSWTDNSNNETGFKIQHCSGTPCIFADVTTVGANVTSYSYGTILDRIHSFRVTAVNAGGESAAVGGSASPGSGYVANGAFSSGLTGWTTSGNAFVVTTPDQFHSISGFARFGTDAGGTALNGSDGTLEQVVFIPSGSTSATLSYWYCITTSETASTAFDKLITTVRTSAGSLLATLDTRSNMDAKSSCGPSQPIENGYTKLSFNLLPYAGQFLRIRFQGTTDIVLPSILRLDDVEITVTP